MFYLIYLVCKLIFAKTFSVFSFLLPASFLVGKVISIDTIAFVTVAIEYIPNIYR